MLDGMRVFKGLFGPLNASVRYDFYNFCKAAERVLAPIFQQPFELCRKFVRRVIDSD